MENRLVPELRFPEFKEDWRIQPIGDHIYLLSGFAFKGDDISENPKGVKLLRGINITEGYIRHSKDIDRYFLGDLTKLKKFLLQEGDMVLGMDGSKVGKNVAIINKEDEDSLLIQRVARVRAKSSSDINFIYSQVFSNRFHRYVDIVNTSSGIPHISSKQINEFKIGFPKLPEQTKIANFLTTVDKRISLLQKKKKQLEQYKKGVMQKLFPAKADCNPSLRFKDENGNKFSDWEEKKLGEIAKYYDGTHQTPKYVSKGIPFYSVEHVTANQFSKTKFISHEVFEKENKRVKLAKNDILMTRIGSIGVAKHIDWDVNASFYVSLALIKWNENFDSKFLCYAINQQNFQRELWKRTIHVAFPQKINLGEIGECKLLLPKIEEQQKIASFLSAIDKRIENIGKQIDASQNWKKGLLQKMFV